VLSLVTLSVAFLRQNLRIRRIKMITWNQIREADEVLAQHGIITNDKTNVYWMVAKANELKAVDDLRSKLEDDLADYNRAARLSRVRPIK
jgi:hypothetical protein